MVNNIHGCNKPVRRETLNYGRIFITVKIYFLIINIFRSQSLIILSRIEDLFNISLKEIILYCKKGISIMKLNNKYFIF